MNARYVHYGELPANQKVFTSHSASQSRSTETGAFVRHSSVCVTAVNVHGGARDTQIGCGRDQRAFSVLTLNLEGTNSEYELPEGRKLPWRERWARVAHWMGDSRTLPDVLALQEIPARKLWWPYDLSVADAMIARSPNERECSR